RIGQRRRLVGASPQLGEDHWAQTDDRRGLVGGIEVERRHFIEGPQALGESEVADLGGRVRGVVAFGGDRRSWVRLGGSVGVVLRRATAGGNHRGGEERSHKGSPT